MEAYNAHASYIIYQGPARDNELVSLRPAIQPIVRRVMAE